MDKTYARINWENEPSVATPLGATNLNKIDYAVNEIDNRVITLDTGKASQTDELLDIKTVAYNSTTGVWTFTHQNGTVDTFDQNIEKIPVSFSMDANGVITMTTADGTQYTCDVSTLIKTYTFSNTSTIQFTTTTDASGNKTVTANVIDGSITRAKLDPTLLSQIDVDVASASASANSASSSASTSTTQALKSEGFAVGQQNGTDVTSGSPYYENNAKYYKEQAQSSATNASTSESNASTSATNASNSATQASTSATTSNTNALKSEGFAVGKQNGTDVDSSSPYYQNNSKYFSQQASTSASNASTSESNALSYKNDASASATSASGSATTASNKALDSEAYAVGTRNGTPVPNTDPAYENNAKYYAEHGTASLAGLTDVNVSGVTNGQVIKYNSTTQKWENDDESGGGANTLADLTDTAISSPSNKQGLIYNGTSNKWENQDIEGLPDNTITYAQFIQMTDAQQLAFTGNVTDYPGIDDAPNADDVIYDNTNSGLTATDVQDAIDEIADNLTASNQTAGVSDVPFRFGCNDDGEYGYIINQGGADTVIPFKETPVLLWTNPNPSSRFGELTLNASISDYPIIIIKYKSSYDTQPPTTGIEYTTAIKRTSSMQTGNSYGIVAQNTSGAGWWVRPITENGTSITFVTNSTPAGVSGGNISNAWVTVLEVYGYKKVVF